MNSLNDNPQLNDIEASLKAAAAAEDAGQSIPAPVVPVVEDKQTAASDKVADVSKEKPVFSGDDAAGDKPDAESKELVKSESKFEKAKKDKERLDRSWKALEAEKAAVRAEAEKIKAEREAAAKQELPERGEGALRYTPEELEQAAKDFAAEGNEEMAAKAMAAAQQVREAYKAKATEATKAKEAQAWAEAIAEHPDLKDEQTPMGQGMLRLLGQHPYIRQIEGWPKHAASIVKLRMQAAAASSLEKRVTELETENKKLKEATSIRSSPPPGVPAEEKSFDTMNAEEQQAHLLKAALAADRGD